LAHHCLSNQPDIEEEKNPARHHLSTLEAFPSHCGTWNQILIGGDFGMDIFWGIVFKSYSRKI
jgi:hypothetical protein